MYQTQREQKEELRSKIIFLLIVISALLFVGMFFYHFAEGWSLVDSLYFSAISITSRGFSQLHPTSWYSVLFSIFYLFIGVGMIIYTISTLVAFYASYYQEKMHNSVKKIGNLFKKEKPKKNKWLVLADKRRKNRPF